MAKLIIYHDYLCELGGCETVLYNMCEQLKDWYDITVLYQGGYFKQIQRLNTIVDTEVYNKEKEYLCDIVIRNSAWGLKPANITATQNKYIQIIHADYKVHKINNTFTYVKWDKTTHHVGCGEHVTKMFKEVTGYDCTTIKNILETIKPINKIYKFIYAGRLFDNDKKANIERIKTFIKMMEEQNIKYNLFIYTNSSNNSGFENNENIIIRKARYYDLHDEMADADYGLLFSDAEGLPCFVQECLQYGTPCIVTNCGGNMELIKDGINGYVVPMNMEFDINKIKKIPKIKDYNNGTSSKTWCDFLGYAEYKPKRSKLEMKIKVECIMKDGYDDMQLNRHIKFGEQFIVDRARANYLIENNGVKEIEIIDEEPIDDKIVEEMVKKTTRKTTKKVNK